MAEDESRRRRLARLLRLAAQAPKANPGQGWTERKAKALAAKAPAVPREVPGAPRGRPTWKDLPREEAKAALEGCLARLSDELEKSEAARDAAAMAVQAEAAREQEELRRLARLRLASMRPPRRESGWRASSDSPARGGKGRRTTEDKDDDG